MVLLIFCVRLEIIVSFVLVSVVVKLCDSLIVVVEVLCVLMMVM